ncbi:hypothetical protein C8J55DRAFT_153515 [Lentinula edodes]|uniref:Mid2 domain-containing protein n=1 Tax=Lentinula lateritia TaxID=40482 RepID=A0A9W9A223_9AGAR|nr:hypothetical protein C8J55DRAFT_153515 [Lentinula edodes]
MRTYSTLIPFVALAFTFAANAVPTSYSPSGNTYNSKASIRELDSDVVQARGFVVDDNSLEERSSALSNEGPTSPMKSNVQSSLERRINNMAIGAGAIGVGALAIGLGYWGKKRIKEDMEKSDASSSTSSSAPDPTSTNSGDECTKFDRREGKC